MLEMGPIFDLGLKIELWTDFNENLNVIFLDIVFSDFRKNLAPCPGPKR
mgnify:CR=1 FL=1